MRRILPLALATLLAAPSLAQDAPVDERVTAALDRAEVVYSTEENGDVRMLYEVSDTGRSQIVWVSPETYKVGAFEVRDVFSYGAQVPAGKPLPAGWADRLLEINDDMIVGAWTRNGDRIIFRAALDADATDQELVDMILVVLTAADLVERELTGADVW